MDALTEQIWNAILAGDLELANELSRQMDQIIDLRWFRPAFESKTFESKVEEADSLHIRSS